MGDQVSQFVFTPANRNASPTPYQSLLSDFDQLFSDLDLEAGEKPSARDMIDATMELRRNPLAKSQELQDQLIVDLRATMKELRDYTEDYNIKMNHKEAELEDVIPARYEKLTIEIAEMRQVHESTVREYVAQIQEMREKLAALDAQIEEMKNQLAQDKDAAEKRSVESRNVLLLRDFLNTVDPFKPT